MQFSTILAIHSWTLYAIAVSFVLSRVTFRRITFGSFKKLQADDWFMIGVLIPFTASIVLANQVSDFQSARERKFRYVLEEMQIITVWMVKACLLALYWRIFMVEISPWKRRTLGVISAFCCLSFLAVQFTLIASCRPVEAHWDLKTSNGQCINYKLHAIVSLAFDVPNTIFIMMLPIPFIPTPRRLLLAVLLILSLLVFFAGVRSRVLILQHPMSPRYVNWYTSETSLSMIFANLPFLTSLVVATAPSKLRDFSYNLRHSSNMAVMPQWPRSRLNSLNNGYRSWDSKTEIKPRPEFDRLDYSGNSSPELQSPVDIEKATEWDINDQVVHEGDACKTPSPIRNSNHSSRQRGDRSSARRSFHCENHNNDSSASSPMSIPEPAVITKRKSSLPKMRLSGGLAEMGDISIALSEEEKEKEKTSFNS